MKQQTKQLNGWNFWTNSDNALLVCCCCCRDCTPPSAACNKYVSYIAIVFLCFHLSSICFVRDCSCWLPKANSHETKWNQMNVWQLVTRIPVQLELELKRKWNEEEKARCKPSEKGWPPTNSVCLLSPKRYPIRRFSLTISKLAAGAAGVFELASAASAAYGCARSGVRGRKFSANGYTNLDTSQTICRGMATFTSCCTVSSSVK